MLRRGTRRTTHNNRAHPARQALARQARVPRRQPARCRPARLGFFSVAAGKAWLAPARRRLSRRAC